VPCPQRGTGSQSHYIAVPPWFDKYEHKSQVSIHGAVLRAGGAIDRFQVVFVGINLNLSKQVVSVVYSSETGVWGNLFSTKLPSKMLKPCANMSLVGDVQPVMVGNQLYWMIAGFWAAILEFDLGRQSLAVIRMPRGYSRSRSCWQFRVMRAEDGELGLLAVELCTARLWKREVDCDGVASWVLRRTI
jgi:hypothetical protein